MIRLIRQFGGFISLSGIGFIIDFFCYLILVNFIGISVFYANMISAIPAITFVFLLSTRYIFKKALTLTRKIMAYVVYLLYQGLLLYCVSKLSQNLYEAGPFPFFASHHMGVKKIMAKLCITPLTMIMNFIIMKHLITFLVKEDNP